MYKDKDCESLKKIYMNNFCDPLREHAMKIINFKNKK